MSPTARCLAECRKRGWIAQVVEQTIPKTYIKRDFLGCIDILALTESGVLGIQATSAAHHAERLDKIRAEPRARRWLDLGNRIEVWSWALRGDAGKRKTWTLRTEAVQ